MKIMISHMGSFWHESAKKLNLTGYVLCTSFANSSNQAVLFKYKDGDYDRRDGLSSFYYGKEKIFYLNGQMKTKKLLLKD